MTQHSQKKLNAAMFALIVSLVSACGPNQKILQSSNERAEPQSNVTTANVEPAKSSFEQDLQAMRNADFKFILVFRRKDGAVLTSADKTFATATTATANRRRLADEGKAIVIGSNFPFASGTLDKLGKRFTMENYSKPDSGPVESNSVPNS